MPKRSKSNRKKGTNQNIRAEGSTIRNLRTLTNEEAFHFYENVGKPTGQSAKNLHEFLDIVKAIKLESLVFHLERNDFENWIAHTLQDSTLAQKIGMLPKENNNELRTKIQTVIEARLGELEKTTLQVADKALLPIQTPSQ